MGRLPMIADGLDLERGMLSDLDRGLSHEGDTEGPGVKGAADQSPSEGVQTMDRGVSLES